AKEPEIESPTKAAARVRVDDVAPDTISTGSSSPDFEKKPAPPPRPRMAPKDAIYHQGSWYWFSDEQVTVQEAAAAAKRLKGRLVTITSDDENQFITEHLRGPTFLGLLKVKKIWLDPSGRPQDYFRWDRGQPSSSGGERFAAILRNGRWHDYVEDRLFLCIEWGKEP
ncbi:MAG TPA: C-type lectin domain-containing protein, partial [Pirellulales bacterium]|nr:C-type lectin domain-containing protein [Pirellulales bacterium]